MARFSDEFLSELRMRCDIEQVISSYVQLKRRGKNLVGLCPFHNEKTPSFTVYPESQSYYCFGCGAGGEVINFIRRAENLDYVEAVSALCDKCGMVMPTDGYDNSIAEKRKRMYEINKEAARFFNSYLFSDEGAVCLDYFKSRGYKKGTLIKFGMGYAPDKWDGLLKYMRQKGYSYEELYEANLANKSTKDDRVRYYDAFRNRAMVPIIDVRGNVVAFGGRVLDDSKPKYINTSDTLVYKKSLGVFGLNYAKNSKEKNLIIVEGYMDAISLHQAGFDNAIACLGTAFTGEMAHLLARYTDEVVLSYDADEAGQKATNRAIGVLNSIGMRLKVVRLTGGKDPDEILKKYGPERFRSLMDGAANDIEFELLQARNGLELQSGDGKMKYLEKVAEILAKTKNSIAQDVYATKIAEELQVNKQAIIARIEQIAKKERYTQSKQHYKKIQQDSMSANNKMAISNNTNIKVLGAEEMIIASLLRNPEYYGKIEKDISKEDFSSDDNKRIFSAVVEKIKDQRSLELTFFTQELTPQQMDMLVKIGKKYEFPLSLKGCLDCIAVLKQEQQRKKAAVPVSDMSDEEFMNLFRNNK